MQREAQEATLEKLVYVARLLNDAAPAAFDRELERLRLLLAKQYESMSRTQK